MMSLLRNMDNGTLPPYKLYTVSNHRSPLLKANRIETEGELQEEDIRRLFFTDEETEFLFMCHEVYAKGKSGIIFVRNEEHARIVCNIFRERGMTATSYLAECIGNIVMVGYADAESAEDMTVEFVMLAYPTRELETYLRLSVYGLSKGMKGDDAQEPVILLDCVGMYHRFGFPDKKRNWDKIEKEITRCASRTLGEEVSCSLMMEIDKPVRPKPYEIISTDDNGISVYKEKRFGCLGLMDKNENILCEAEFHELGVTSYGWYIGVCRYYDNDKIYSSVIDIRHGKKYLFGEIRHIDEFLYEADVVDYEDDELLGIIRFNGFLKLVPSDTFVINGITIYNVSGLMGVNVFTVSLSLDAKLFGYCYKKGRDKVEMVELGTLDKVIYKRVKAKTEN